MALDDELKAQILRYHFVEHWRVGTIASQLGVHHSTVERVLGEAGVERERQRPRRPSKLDPYMAFITETLERFPSLEERLDTSSAAGELVFHVFGSIAHFERRLISERTRDGIAAARKRGRTPGRPPLDPVTVSAAQKLIEAGLSPGQAAKQIGIGRATAYRIAKTMR